MFSASDYSQWGAEPLQGYHEENLKKNLGHRKDELFILSVPLDIRQDRPTRQQWRARFLFVKSLCAAVANGFYVRV